MIAAVLLLSDGTVIRTIQPAAMPPALRQEVERFVLSQLVDDAIAVEKVERAVASLVQGPGKVGAGPRHTDASPAAARAEARSAAKAQGYTGDFCTKCSGSRMKIAGHCTVCDDCGETTGCS